MSSARVCFRALVLSAALAACRSTEPSGATAGDCREPAASAMPARKAAAAASSAVPASTVAPIASSAEGPVVDATLLAFLSKARAVHLQADIAEEDGKRTEAVRVLDGLVRAPAPGGEAPGPEVREVLADTLARLAELESALDQDDAARARVRRGLELATDRTHFRGRLFEVLGAVEKRAFERLKKGGDEVGAQQAKDRSLAALKEAIAIQESVIDGALGGDR